MLSLVPLTHGRKPADSLCRIIHARVDLTIMHLLNMRWRGLQGIAAEAAPHHCRRDGRRAHLQQERKHCEAREEERDDRRGSSGWPLACLLALPCACE